MLELEKIDNLEPVPPSTLEAIQRAEVDVAITTAKRYPRDIAQSIKICRELALRNAAVAATCNYAVPRAGKKLVGPSVHFARIVAYSWGNSTAISRVVGADRANVHLQGVFHDLQTNLRIGIEMDWPVQPPKDDRPERWADQINLAKRAGSAVALRSAIFNVIPQVLFSDIAEDAKKVAVGEGKTFIESRNNAITALKAIGVSQEMLYRALEVGGLESISTDDLIWLHAVMTSIKDGAMTVAEIFGNSTDPVRAQVPPRRGRPPKDVSVEITPEKEEHTFPSESAGTEKSKVEPPPTFVAQGFTPPIPPPTPVPTPTPTPPPAERQTPPAAPRVPREELLDPFPEPKPLKKKEPPKPAPSPEMDAVARIRNKLAETDLIEADVLKWLEGLQTIPEGTVSLETVKLKWLDLLLKDWEGICAKIRNSLGRSNG